MTVMMMVAMILMVALAGFCTVKISKMTVQVNNKDHVIYSLQDRFEKFVAHTEHERQNDRMTIELMCHTVQDLSRRIKVLEQIVQRMDGRIVIRGDDSHIKAIRKSS